MYTELTEDNLAQLIQDKNKTVIVQYSAGWCGNCRVMKPKFKNFSEEYEHVEFVVVDAEQFPASRQLASVTNLPTFAAFKNGIVSKQIQTNKAETLKQFIDEITSN
jgi:thiol-disulfide isomerase/thioredoxin